MKRHVKKAVFIILALLLTASPLTSAISASGGKWGLEDITFTDTRGNYVTIPGGAASCATRVVRFTPGNPWTSDPRAMNPDDTLGAPDYDSSQDINYLNLGIGGVLVLEFDIYVYDGPGNDIYVFEIGPDVEATRVEVSEDCVNWIYVGDADGSVSGVDMNGKVPANGRYKYVRITDIRGVDSSWPGADIDAVAFINVSPFNNSSWAEREIETAFDLGLIPGKFYGEDLTTSTTRAEFCILAVTLYETVKGTTITGRTTFSDTSDINVEKAAYIGVVSGVGNNRFAPGDTLTREQAAAMLARLAAAVNSPLKMQSATFNDNGSISSWALDAVGQCQAAGIMGGTGENTFSPKGAYQRQQSIATILRMYHYLKG